MGILVVEVGVFPSGFLAYLLGAHFLCFLGIGGRDDAKVSIPATVVLRYMFSPAEMRVGSCPMLL